jgi:hemoglobin
MANSCKARKSGFALLGLGFKICTSLPAAKDTGQRRRFNMPAFRRRLGLMLVAVLQIALFASRAQAQDTKQLDQRIFDLLKEIINTGADVYNANTEDRDVYTRENNRAGCYRLYQGSLLTLRPLLGHHPDLQKTIDNSFAKAAKQASMAERAFTLRDALDEIRRVLKPGGEEKTAGGSVSTDTGSPGSSATLWSRLGGEAKVTKIIDDLLTRVKADPKVDFYRGGTYKPTDLEFKTMRDRFVDYISAVTKGPRAYRGVGNRSMESIHRGMGITDAQFTAMMDDFRQVLAANDVKSAESQELLQIIESTRKDIVAAKSPNDTLLDGFRKPADKK